VRDFIEPAGLYITIRIKSGYIGLDVKNRNPVEYVYILNLNQISLNTNKADNREPDGIRPLRCQGCKYTVRKGIKEWFNFEGISLAPIECIDKNDPGEAVQVL